MGKDCDYSIILSHNAAPNPVFSSKKRGTFSPFPVAQKKVEKSLPNVNNG
jgi:hypothetical protein